MITPKPATVFDLFNGHPERWTKGECGRNADGIAVGSFHPHTVCWCLGGAINFVYEDLGENFKAEAKLNKVLTCDHYILWNDEEETTFEQMLAKVKEAGI